MYPEQQLIRLSERLLALAEVCQTRELSLSFLLTKLGVSSHALVVFIFSIPFLLPIPVPGLSILLGGLIALSGLAIAIGRPIWLPKVIADRSIDGSLVAKIFFAASKLVKKIEFLFRPRLTKISDNTIIRTFAGLVIAVSGIVLLLPLPPGTNFPPALVCVLLAVGLLERDGLLLLIGFSFFALKILLIFNLYSYFSDWILVHFALHDFMENMKIGKC
jgi:hypothetical protein